MTLRALQALEVGSLAVVAGGGHVAITWLRRSFLAGLEKLAGGQVRDLARISDLVVALICVGFAVAAVPIGHLQPASMDVDAVLDTIGLFALVVALVEVTSLFLLNRIAHHLEPWPPDSFERSAS